MNFCANVEVHDKPTEGVNQGKAISGQNCSKQFDYIKLIWKGFLELSNFKSLIRVVYDDQDFLLYCKGKVLHVASNIALQLSFTLHAFHNCFWGPNVSDLALKIMSTLFCVLGSMTVKLQIPSPEPEIYHFPGTKPPEEPQRTCLGARQDLPAVLLEFHDMFADNPSQTPEFDTQWFDKRERREKIQLEAKTAQDVLPDVALASRLTGSSVQHSQLPSVEMPKASSPASQANLCAPHCVHIKMTKEHARRMKSLAYIKVLQAKILLEETKIRYYKYS
ncbi:hypothetical protein CPB84DRAFT_1748507 [Gymnopilus junonius]|uniref:Uncharacterized protein n=1 Tax=Gymnopilus junonius TaxID=109634 RepID=A0A9P5NK61_GYMJU|nr:hypothetical protein CPB84DRAFT_1748507 [Gymnopilus junonius]